MNKLVLSVAATLALIFAYFFFYDAPSCNQNITELQCRLYYLRLGIFTAASTSFVGLTLGTFYYFDKKKHEQEKYILSIISNYLNTLISTIDDFDEHVQSLFRHDFKNKNELNLLQERIRSKFDVVYDLLEHPHAALNIASTEIGKIIEVNSYIDKLEEIFSHTYEKVKTTNFRNINLEYSERLRVAKRIIYSKMESFGTGL